MIFEEKTRDAEKSYEVYYDKGNLKSLRDRINKKVGYKLSSMPYIEPCKPRLSRIINDFLQDDPNAMQKLLDYQNDKDFISIDEKIKLATEKLNVIDIFDVDNKLLALNELRNLYEAKKCHWYFNVELLKQYYLRVCSSIKLKSISENNNEIITVSYLLRSNSDLESENNYRQDEGHTRKLTPTNNKY